MTQVTRQNVTDFIGANQNKFQQLVQSEKSKLPRPKAPEANASSAEEKEYAQRQLEYANKVECIENKVFEQLWASWVAWVNKSAKHLINQIDAAWQSAKTWIMEKIDALFKAA